MCRDFIFEIFPTLYSTGNSFSFEIVPSSYCFQYNSVRVVITCPLKIHNFSCSKKNSHSKSNQKMLRKKSLINLYDLLTIYGSFIYFPVNKFVRVMSLSQNVFRNRVEDKKIIENCMVIANILCMLVWHLISQYSCHSLYIWFGDFAVVTQR